MTSSSSVGRLEHCLSDRWGFSVGTLEANRQGSKFEAEVAKLLRAAGFEVIANAGTARPRQTDLFARGDSIDLLIEAKNRKHTIHVGDIDDMRSRLHRTPPDIVGVIFTTSKLTHEAIRAIESDRQREILVFVRDEIDRLRRGEQNLKALVERKRKELRVGGKVWFGPIMDSEYNTINLPVASAEFKVGDTTSLYFESKSRFSGACFALEIPDPGWGMSGGEGARLAIDLAVNTGKDLRNIFGYLHARFGLSKKGMFSIQQSECSWYGVGPENFLQTMEAWRKRYEKSKLTRFHHSESLVYFDHFRNGWVEISAQQNLSPGNYGDRELPLFHCQLVIQLPGIPVDTAPYLKLCQYAGADWANFEFIGSRWTIARRLKKPLRLRSVGTIVDKNPFPDDRAAREGTVVGVIAKNPFYGMKTLPKELLDFDRGAQAELTETELLPCALSDWHSPDMTVDYYRLMGIETTAGGVSYIIRPFGTWNKELQ
jgi:Holliday junction resolvase